MSIKTWWVGPQNECCPKGYVCESCDTNEWTPQENWWAFKTNVRHRLTKTWRWLAWYLPFTPRYVELVTRGTGKETRRVVGVYRTFHEAFEAGLEDDGPGWMSMKTIKVR
jgi:hypothetical protein